MYHTFALRRFGVPLVLVVLAWGAAAASGSPPERLTPDAARRLVDELVPKVEELRGLAFKRPVPVEVVGDDAMRDYVLRRIRSFDQERHLDTLQEVYRLLGLIPEDADLLDLLIGAMEEQVGGFYDPSKKAYFLLDDVPASAAPIFTAHELTHALEDQHYDLDGRLEEWIDDDDRSLAVGAVHEGSATILMSVYMVGAVMRGEMDTGTLREIAESEAGRAAKLRALPEVLLRQMLGPYVLGAVFLGGGDLLNVVGGYPSEAVNRALSDGPASSEQILHPEKYWDDEQRDEPRTVEFGRLRKVLGKGWTLRGDGVLGELTLGTLVGAGTPREMLAGGMPAVGAWTNQAASGWGGDRWELWEREERSILLLRVDWDSPADAEEFVEALPEREGLRWRRSDDRVAIVAGEGRMKTERLLSRMLR